MEAGNHVALYGDGGPRTIASLYGDEKLLARTPREEYQMADDPSIPTAVSASFQKLKAAAAQLNTASDQLGKVVSDLDAALKTLNLGVPAWIPVIGEDDPHSGEYWSLELGYDRFGGKWGISLRRSEGNYNHEPEGGSTTWLFADAPRVDRIEAIDKLGVLIEKLTQEASTVVGKVEGKVEYARQVVAAITPPKAAGLEPRVVSVDDIATTVRTARAAAEFSSSLPKSHQRRK